MQASGDRHTPACNHSSSEQTYAAIGTRLVGVFRVGTCLQTVELLANVVHSAAAADVLLKLTYWLEGVLGASAPKTSLLSCWGAGIGCMQKKLSARPESLASASKLVTSNRALGTVSQMRTECKPHLELPVMISCLTAPQLAETYGLSGTALVQWGWDSLHAKGLPASMRKASMWPHVACTWDSRSHRARRT